MSSPAFQVAVSKSNAAKGSGKKLSNDQLLQLYAHFKQGSVGPNRTPKPGMFDLKGAAKWSSWSSLGAMSQEAAQAKYVQLVSQWC
jgi:diazepam-binding inhibitor (GABA receptor modulator, acyl-CoA-binding protein)